MMLLVALIECLGPSVLRSAPIVLQCIGTVLETYTTPVTPFVVKRQQTCSVVQVDDTGGEEEKEDEILTECLNVVMTILEMGRYTAATQRNSSFVLCFRCWRFCPTTRDPKPQDLRARRVRGF